MAFPYHRRSRFLIFPSIPLSKRHYIYPPVYVITQPKRTVPTFKMLSWIYPLRIVQAILSLATIGLTAYGLFHGCMTFTRTTLNPFRNRLSVRQMVLLKCHLLHALQRLLDNSHRNPILGPRTPTLPSLLA